MEVRGNAHGDAPDNDPITPLAHGAGGVNVEPREAARTATTHGASVVRHIRWPYGLPASLVTGRDDPLGYHPRADNFLEEGA